MFLSQVLLFQILLIQSINWIIEASPAKASINVDHAEPKDTPISALKSTDDDLKLKVQNLIAENEVLKDKFKEYDLKLEAAMTESRKLLNTPVGFTAWATVTRGYNAGDRVLFDDTLSNFGGHYNKTKSTFTCPANGIYLFALHVDEDANAMTAAIRLDEVNLVHVHAHGERDMASNNVIIHCGAGHIVDVVCTDDNSKLLGSETSRHSTFSGTLLQLDV